MINLKFKMSTAKLEDGGWTPALRQMSIELIDSLINRPASAVISDPKPQTLSFQSIREKLTRRRYQTIDDFANDVNTFFTQNIESGDELQKDVAADFQITFNKAISEIIELSHFKFRTIATRICADIDAIKKEADELDF